MMKINQEYMDDYVIKPIMQKFAEIEKHIEKVDKKINLLQITLNYNQKRSDEIKKIVEEIKKRR